MRQNYSAYAIGEAVVIESARKFVAEIKRMDSDTAAMRLYYLAQQSKVPSDNAAFLSSFVILADVETSADMDAKRE